MSRAAQSKSRADKKQSAPTPAVTHEIVPGKFTDVDWNRMLELDDGEDFIGDIVDEVVSGTLSIIYDKYIERQLLPYTVSQAKQALLTIIDWRFLACDSGEESPSTDPTWQEDDEPVAAIPDCWAQGSVPKTFATRAASVASLKEDSASLINETIREELEPSECRPEEEPKPWIVRDEEVVSVEPVAIKMDQSMESTMIVEEAKVVPTPPTGAKAKKSKFRPRKGRLLSAGVSNMLESLEETEKRITTEERMKMKAPEEQVAEKPAKLNTMPKSVGSILKFQSGRPPGSRDVYYDEQGNVIAMSKINPDRLPTHRIKTKFYVVDPAVEAAQARLDAMRTGRFTASKPKRAPVPVSDKTKLDRSSILDLRSVNSQNKRQQPTMTQQGGAKSANSVTPLPPPMIESMELAPGVIVREGDRVKKGPRQMMRTADRLPKKDSLRPVGIEPDMTISVQELLGNRGPLVRMESAPVPPIISNRGMNNAQKIAST